MTETSLSLEELASLTGTQLVGDASMRIKGAASLKEAGPNDVSFFGKQPYGQKKSQYKQQVKESRAGIIILPDDLERDLDQPALIAKDPSKAFQKALEHFLDLPKTDYSSGWKEIHPTAVIHPTAEIGEGVTIGPLAVIDSKVKIGKNTVVGSHCYIGSQTSVGANCLFHPRTTVRERCTIGHNVILHPGVVIGACGFGYHSDAKGHHKLRQLGVVILEDNVEVGANSCIDRARFGQTRIGKGTKIDNLVQIAHGVEIGEDNLIVGQVGIAGSATTGKRVVIAGQAAINGHIHITDDVILAARTGVMRSIKTPGSYAGTPAIPLKVYLRNVAAMCKIGEYVSSIKKMLPNTK